MQHLQNVVNSSPHLPLSDHIRWPCPCLLMYTVRATPPKHRRLVTTSSTLASYKMAAPLPTRVYGSCYTSRTSSLQYLWLSHRIWWLCLCLLAGTLGDRLIQFMQHLQKHHCSQYLPLLHHIWWPCLLIYHAPSLHTTLLLLLHSFSQYSEVLLIDIFNAILRKWHYNES